MTYVLTKKVNIVGLTVVLTLIFSSFFFISTSAQEVSQAIDISIQSSPLRPKAGESVELEAISYGVDLNQANISWTYNDKVVASGLGRTRITVIAPTSGTTAIVAVLASASGISPVSATLVLNPGSIDLIWEGANSFTPPFYKGRALLAPTGILRVVAIPAIGVPRQGNFQWSRNDSAVQSASGAGASSIVLQNTPFEKTEKISVSLSGGLFNGSNSLTIVPRSPNIVAYQKKNGFVDYANGSTGSIVARGSGTTVLFEPFFFSFDIDGLNGLVFDMSVGEETAYGDPQNELRLSRPEDGSSGEISVGVSTKNYSLQNARRTFNLRFE